MGVLKDAKDAAQGKRRCNGCGQRKSPTFPRGKAFFCEDCKGDFPDPRKGGKRKS